MRNKFLTLIACGLIGLVGGLLGLAIGVGYGGNFATDFQFAGERGYEATGFLGWIIGFVVTALVASLFIRAKD